MLSKSTRKCEAVSVENNLHPYAPHSVSDSNSEAVCWGTISQIFKCHLKYACIAHKFVSEMLTVAYENEELSLNLRCVCVWQGVFNVFG